MIMTIVTHFDRFTASVLKNVSAVNYGLSTQRMDDKDLDPSYRIMRLFRWTRKETTGIRGMFITVESYNTSSVYLSSSG